MDNINMDGVITNQINYKSLCSFTTQNLVLLISNVIIFFLQIIGLDMCWDLEFLMTP